MFSNGGGNKSRLRFVALLYFAFGQNRMHANFVSTHLNLTVMIRKLLAEGIGTMFLVILACGSAVLAGPSIGGLGIGICFGLVLLCLCYCIGGISGCHVNPAVSFAMLLSGRMKGSEFIGYVVAQLIGATIGAGFLYCLTRMGLGYDYGGTTAISGSYLATNVLQPGATPMMALLTEGLLTFFFVLVVLGATDSRTSFTKFGGIAIGLALGLVNIVGIPVDNCSVNPARSFGPAVFDPTAWGDFWIMLVGPAIGAILAAIAWKALSATKAPIE